jgi:hypothetical protein
VSTWTDLKTQTPKSRKLVIPNETALAHASTLGGGRQALLARDKYSSQAEWLAACYFEFERATEAHP